MNEIKQEAVTPNTLKGAQPQKATVGDNASSGGIVTEHPDSVKDSFSSKNTQAEKTLNQNGIELLNGDTATMQYSLKKTDIAKSVSDDATLYAQVKSDQDIADAMRHVTRLHNSQQGAANWEKRYHRMNQRECAANFWRAPINLSHLYCGRA